MSRQRSIKYHPIMLLSEFIENSDKRMVIKLASEKGSRFFFIGSIQEFLDDLKAIEIQVLETGAAPLLDRQVLSVYRSIDMTDGYPLIVIIDGEEKGEYWMRCEYESGRVEGESGSGQRHFIVKRGDVVKIESIIKKIIDDVARGYSHWQWATDGKWDYLCDGWHCIYRIPKAKQYLDLEFVLGEQTPRIKTLYARCASDRTIDKMVRLRDTKKTTKVRFYDHYVRMFTNAPDKYYVNSGYLNYINKELGEYYLEPEKHNLLVYERGELVAVIAMVQGGEEL